MKTNFGPWTSALETTGRAELSGIWTRRLAQLPLAGMTASRPRWVVAALTMLIASAVLMPAVQSGPGQAKPVVAEPKAEAAASADAKSTGEPTAEELIRKIYDDEQWPTRVEGFHLRLAILQKHTAEGLKPRPKIPGPFAPKPSDKPPSAELAIDTQIAWDAKRVMLLHRVRGRDSETVDRRTYSGALAIEQSTRMENGAVTGESFVLDDKVDQLFQHAFEFCLQWGKKARRMGPLVWWRKLETQQRGDKSWTESTEIRLPTGVRLAGREIYNGHDCYRVDSQYGSRYYVRVSDRRLTGDLQFSYRTEPAQDLAIKSQIAGRTLETHNDWTAWLDSLAPQQRAAAEAQYQAEHDRRMILVSERTFDDYRELAPGCWFPSMQRYRSYRTESGESKLGAEGNVRVVEAVVNPTLPDELFAHEIPEGSDISTDWRYDPPIRYVYHAAQSEEERQQLAAKERAQRDEGKKIFDDIKKAIDERIGQSPPKLPRDGWINSTPLNWQELRGKAVALVFWDIGCGPCHFTMDLMQDWIKDAKAHGRAIIAVHRHTKDRAAVEQELAKNDWKMPVLIDADGKDPDIPSLFDWLHISGMPWVVLVNCEGEIVAHDVGTLGSEIFAKFGELSRAGSVTAK